MPTILDDDHVLIPHLPDWTTPPECARAWETGVDIGITIAEDRQLVRATPLRSLSWTVLPHDQREHEKLAADVRAALKQGNAAVPWWGRGLKVGAAGVAPGATIIPISYLMPFDWIVPLLDPGVQIWAAGPWATGGGAAWELWTVTGGTWDGPGFDYQLEIETATALTLAGGALAVWPLLRGRFTADEIPYDRPTMGTYRLKVSQPSGFNPGVASSAAPVYWGRHEVAAPAALILDLPSIESLDTIERIGGYDFATEFGTTLTEIVESGYSEAVRAVPWSHSQNFVQFDPSLGRLKEVEFLIGTHISLTGWRGENLDSVPHTFTPGVAGTMTLSDPTPTLLLSVTKAVDETITVAGGAFQNVGAPFGFNDTDSVLFTEADPEFAQFIQGSGTVSLSLTGSLVTTGAVPPFLVVTTIGPIGPNVGGSITQTFRHQKNEGYFWLAVPDYTGWAPRGGDGARLVSTEDIYPMATAADMGVATEINGVGYALANNAAGVLYRIFRGKYPVYSGDDDAVLIEQ